MYPHYCQRNAIVTAYCGVLLMRSGEDLASRVDLDVDENPDIDPFEIVFRLDRLEDSRSHLF
jgi:hypothetical protein